MGGTWRHLVAWNVCRASEQVGVRHPPSQKGMDSSQSEVETATCSKEWSQSFTRQKDRQARWEDSVRVRAPEAEPIKRDDTSRVLEAQRSMHAAEHMVPWAGGLRGAGGWARREGS